MEQKVTVSLTTPLDALSPLGRSGAVSVRRSSLLRLPDAWSLRPGYERHRDSQARPFVTFSAGRHPATGACSCGGHPGRRALRSLFMLGCVRGPLSLRCARSPLAIARKARCFATRSSPIGSESTRSSRVAGIPPDRYDDFLSSLWSITTCENRMQGLREASRRLPIQRHRF